MASRLATGGHRTTRTRCRSRVDPGPPTATRRTSTPSSAQVLIPGPRRPRHRTSSHRDRPSQDRPEAAAEPTWPRRRSAVGTRAERRCQATALRSGPPLAATRAVAAASHGRPPTRPAHRAVRRQDGAARGIRGQPRPGRTLGVRVRQVWPCELPDRDATSVHAASGIWQDGHAVHERDTTPGDDGRPPRATSFASRQTTTSAARAPRALAHPRDHTPAWEIPSARGLMKPSNATSARRRPPDRRRTRLAARPNRQRRHSRRVTSARRSPAHVRRCQLRLSRLRCHASSDVATASPTQHVAGVEYAAVPERKTRTVATAPVHHADTRESFTDQLRAHARHARHKLTSVAIHSLSTKSATLPPDPRRSRRAARGGSRPTRRCRTPGSGRRRRATGAPR